MYSLLRVLIFAGLLAVLAMAGVELWLAAVIAALISLCVAFIFLKQPSLPVRPERGSDEDDEDALLEGDGGREAEREGD